jgi:hypothetical protein
MADTDKKPSDPVDWPILSSFITEKEYMNTKTLAQMHSVSITGLKEDVDFLKFAFAGLSAGLTVASLGLQVLKVDYSLFKIDEKGFSFRGRTLAAFDRADVEKMLDNELAKKQKVVIDLVNKIETRGKRLERKQEALNQDRTKTRAERREAQKILNTKIAEHQKLIDRLKKAIPALNDKKNGRAEAEAKHQRRAERWTTKSMREKPRSQGYEDQLATIKKNKQLQASILDLVATIG